MYCLSDWSKALGNALHRLHCAFFDDNEYDFDDYCWTYAPFALILGTAAIAGFIKAWIGV